MTTLTQQEKQVVTLFQQLEPQRRRHVLLEMARTDSCAWKRFQTQGEARLSVLAREKGLDWEVMNDDQRQEFVEEYLDGDPR